MYVKNRDKQKKNNGFGTNTSCTKRLPPRCGGGTAKVDHDKVKRQPTTIEGLPPQIQASHNKLVEQLSAIDQLLAERKSRYLLGNAMTEYDCELLPRLHQMRIVGRYLLNFDIPHNLIYLWNYISLRGKVDDTKGDIQNPSNILYTLLRTRNKNREIIYNKKTILIKIERKCFFF